MCYYNGTLLKHSLLVGAGPRSVSLPPHLPLPYESFRLDLRACWHPARHYSEALVGEGLLEAYTEMGLSRNDFWLQTKYSHGQWATATKKGACLLASIILARTWFLEHRGLSTNHCMLTTMHAIPVTPNIDIKYKRHAVLWSGEAISARIVAAFENTIHWFTPLAWVRKTKKT